LDKGKGIETLLRAFANLSIKNRLLLDLVGSGLEGQNLQNLAVELGIRERVTFVGSRKQEDLPELFSRWDVLIFPSELPESLGLVGLEAMACGLPVIGSDAAGVKTYLKDGINGLSFTPGDIGALKLKIEDFYGLNTEDLKKLKENAISTAAGYDRNTVNKELKNRIQGLFYS
jgi:glycosyltransferase involved in cell wall biosynthesis